MEASEHWSDRCREVDAAYENVRRLLNSLTGSFEPVSRDTPTLNVAAKHLADSRVLFHEVGRP